MIEQRIVCSVDARNMPDYEAMGHDELLNAAQVQWLMAQDYKSLHEHDEARIDELEAENNALKQEIKVCNGNMRCAIHNAEIAKVKAERMRAEYEKRLSEQPDEFWRKEVRLANGSRDFWKREHDKMLKLVQDATTLLRGKGKYTEVDQ